MLLKTPEERRAIARKGLETRRRNAEEMRLAQEPFRLRIAHLMDEVAALEKRRDSLVGEIATQERVSALTSHTLLSEDSLVADAVKFQAFTGIYFLIKDKRVVYVGQSINISSRMIAHIRNGVDFDAYSIVQCDGAQLDLLESFYIHNLKPTGNGRLNNGEMHAPISMAEIMRRVLLNNSKGMAP